MMIFQNLWLYKYKHKSSAKYVGLYLPADSLTESATYIAYKGTYTFGPIMFVNSWTKQLKKKLAYTFCKYF